MSAGFETTDAGHGQTTLTLHGELDARSVGQLWERIMAELDRIQPQQLTVDAADVSYCDGAGVGLLVELNRRQQEAGQTIAINGLKDQFRNLLDVFGSDPLALKPQPPAQPEGSAVEEIGEQTTEYLGHIADEISFIGSLFAAMTRALLSPRKKIRWKDVLLIVAQGGVDAVPIVFMINFLVGLIMSFQAAIPMRQFGADVFVADLVSLSILRVLGPLMTAIVLTGRTGSAFAAELGTMQVNEEINALKTMGIDPVQFLVMNRVVAVLIFTPVLTLIADFAGLLGGLVVFNSLGHPLVTYINQINNAVALHDFLGGFIKSFAFAAIIAAVGCLRGLETSTGASAVGRSATHAVVTGLTLIIMTDGVFSVIYYYLGI